MLKYNGNLGKDAPQTFHHLSSTLLLGHIYLVCKGDGKNLQYIKCDVKISFKDRQHQSRGGFKFCIIDQEPKGVEYHVICQMKGTIFL